MTKSKLPSMEIHFLVDFHIVQVSLQLPRAWLPSMPQRVQPTTLPYLYKPIGLCAKLLFHRQVTFWGQVDIFP